MPKLWVGRTTLNGEKKGDGLGQGLASESYEVPESTKEGRLQHTNLVILKIYSTSSNVGIKQPARV